MRSRIPGLALTVAGLAIGLEAMTFDVTFLTDPVGPKALPGLAGLMMTLAGLHATLSPTPETPWPPRHVAGKLAAATVTFVVYAFLLAPIGFWLSTTLAVAVLSGLYGAPPRRALVAAGLLSAGLWLLFVRALALPLPLGTLWMR